MNFSHLPNCSSFFDSNRSLLFCCLHYTPIYEIATNEDLYDGAQCALCTTIVFAKISPANEILANKLVNNYSTCLNSKSGIFIIHHLHMYVPVPYGICHHLPCRLCRTLVRHQMHANQEIYRRRILVIPKMSYISRTI